MSAQRPIAAVLSPHARSCACVMFPHCRAAMAATHGLTFFSVSENFVRHALERAARGVTREAANVTT